MNSHNTKILHRCLLSPLLYSDIFDWPLELEEIEQYLITTNDKEREVLKAWLKKFPTREKRLKEIERVLQEECAQTVDSKKVEGRLFYFLRNRGELVKRRLRNEKESQKKLKLLKRITNILKLCPWVKMIAASGKVSVGDAEKDDDIDIFVVVAKDRLWLARLWIWSVLGILGMRMKQGMKNKRNKICVNYMIAEDSLDKVEKNLLVAHDISYMKVVHGEDVYRRFVEVNGWVREWLPMWKGNGIDGINGQNGLNGEDPQDQAKPRLHRLDCLHRLNHVLGNWQKRLIARHQTTEVVSDNKLVLISNDRSKLVEREFKRRLNERGVLL